jgi:DNA-binding GntR family transcriptional regulator
VAPPSIREVFDDHKGLTDALRQGDADATAAAITDHVNRVRSALAAFVATESGVSETSERARFAG